MFFAKKKLNPAMMDLQTSLPDFFIVILNKRSSQSG
jgi:hypothetical protein